MGHRWGHHWRTRILRDLAELAPAWRDPAVRGDAYAGPVAVADGLSYLDRVVARSGRDPHWTARRARD